MIPRPSVGRCASFALVLTLTGCGGDSPTDLTRLGCEATPPQLLFEAINEVRALRGIAPLSIDERLASAAQAHADDMALNNFFERTGSDGASVEDRVAAAGFQALFVLENLGAGHPTATELIRDWVDSPSHEAVLRVADGTHVGIGYARNPDADWTDYWSMTVSATQGPTQVPSNGCHP
jgi:uncharacterized protein YkwD